MPSQPPLLLFDNKFDRINQYPGATLIAPYGAAPNRPISKVADYRRERTFYQPLAAQANTEVQVDLGVGNTGVVDTIFIDRGHNLWGKTIYVDASATGAAWGQANRGPFVVPALVNGQFVPGGDPTAGWCVTEEGAIYQVWNNAAAWRLWRVYVVENMQPILTGIILGQRTQLDSYSRVLDEDAGGRKRTTDESEAGYGAASRVYPYRTLLLELGVIGATEYDTKIRLARRAIFEKDIPLFVVMNYGRWPERGWLYKLDADRWAAPTNGVHRSTSIPLRELYSVIR